MFGRHIPLLLPPEVAITLNSQVIFVFLGNYFCLRELCSDVSPLSTLLRHILTNSVCLTGLCVIFLKDGCNFSARIHVLDLTFLYLWVCYEYGNVACGLPQL